MAVSKECGGGEVIPERIDNEAITHLLQRVLTNDPPRAQAQLPDTCRPPALAAHPPAGTSAARVDDAVGVLAPREGDLNVQSRCSKRLCDWSRTWPNRILTLGSFYKVRNLPRQSVSPPRPAV